MMPVNRVRKEARTHWNDPHKLLSILDSLSARTGVDGEMRPDAWPDMGLLRGLDYQVGETSLISRQNSFCGIDFVERFPPCWRMSSILCPLTR
jgi:hypothetical protein